MHAKKNRYRFRHSRWWMMSKWKTYHYGHVSLDRRNLKEKMVQRTERSFERADPWDSDVETCERICRSCYARDSGFGRQVVTMTHLDIWKARKGWHEISLFTRCYEDAFETDQDDLLEKVDSQTRVWEAERRSLVWSYPSHVTKENWCRRDRQALSCLEKKLCGRRMGAEKVVR